jgi:phosphoglycerate-specific signal transduction histidine kinase
MTAAPATSLSPELEQPLLAVEAALNQLGDALARRDAAAIEQHAADLHQHLARAVQSFSEAARSGSVPSALRNRLVRAGGLLAAQRESLARGNASLDRALDVLIPSEPTGLYGASGKAERRSTGGGSFQA